MVGIPSNVNVLETLEHERFVRLLTVGFGALFAYDVLINLDVEIEFIWGSIWTVLNPRKRGGPTLRVGPLMFNLMYLAQRYMPFIDCVLLDSYFILGAPDPTSCLITYNVSACTGLFIRVCSTVSDANHGMDVGSSILGIYFSELTLVLRIWAVWETKSNIGILLVVFLLACSVSAAVFLARFLRGVECYELQIAAPAEEMGRCFCVMGNKDIYVSWILLMVIDTVAIPAFRAYREGGSSHLMRVVYRDGILYYSLILSEAPPFRRSGSLLN
ncbi:hypothetical protein L218DRAFT_1004765 [Marasmius fiardii PR-910]|nr:hypothetical protein L218DRAFT_1004765 [Marasmius fiardii PR-910]